MTDSRSGSIKLEVKETRRRGKLLAFSDVDAPNAVRAMTDVERKAHDYIQNIVAGFDTESVDPGVVGHVCVDEDGGFEVEWCSDEARAAAGGRER